MVASLSSDSKSGNCRRSRRIIVFLGILLVVICTGIFCFRHVGKWLMVQDPLSHSNAIVVLSGGMPYRAEEAARLYRQGYAPQVRLTQPRERPADLTTLGVEYRGEEFYNRQVLEHLGVPTAAIRVLSPPIENTADEVRAIVEEMRREGARQVMIVTSPQHTRRVHALWKRLAGKNVTAVIRAAPEDPYDAEHWWRDTHDINAVMHELLGLMDSEAGLPVRPSAR
jgi:uncharacterized SAM-binding protein YcdF (DUF218 family)